MWTQPDYENELVALKDFVEAGKSPVNMHWLLHSEREQLLDKKVLHKYGKKLLVDPYRFYDYLRERSEKQIQKAG